MRYEDPNVTTTALVGLIGALLLLVIIVGLQALVAGTQRQEFQRKVVDRPNAELTTLRSQQMEKLAGYRYVDQKHGVVAVPIERAMELVVRQYQERQAGAAR